MHHVRNAEATKYGERRKNITSFLRYIEKHPELFYKNMYLHKTFLEMAVQLKRIAEQSGDIELFAACMDLRKSIKP